MKKMQPKEVLCQAREAFRNKNYQQALESYSYFFDHALDDDPAQHYGVRLSYCLFEWARLGQQYPRAKSELINQRDESLGRFLDSGEPEAFLDFRAICRALDQIDYAISEFLKIHERDKGLASKGVKFIAGDLIKHRQFEAYAHYITNVEEKVNIETNRLIQIIGTLKGDDLFNEQDILKQTDVYYEKICDLVLALKSVERNDEANQVLELINRYEEFTGLRDSVFHVEEKLRQAETSQQV